MSEYSIQQDSDDFSATMEGDTAYEYFISILFGYHPEFARNFWGGLRFQSINVDSVINSATIKFIAQSSVNNTDIIPIPYIDIYGVASDNEGTSSNTTDFNNKISNLTNNYVPWSPGEWVAESEYETPDLSIIVDEITSRTGWENGNSIVFIFKSVGTTQYGIEEFPYIPYDYRDDQNKVSTLEIDSKIPRTPKDKRVTGETRRIYG